MIIPAKYVFTTFDSFWESLNHHISLKKCQNEVSASILNWIYEHRFRLYTSKIKEITPHWFSIKALSYYEKNLVVFWQVFPTFQGRSKSLTSIDTLEPSSGSSDMAGTSAGSGTGKDAL